MGGGGITQVGRQHHHWRGTGDSARGRSGCRRHSELAFVGGHGSLDFCQTSGRNLLAAEAAAGVGHHIPLSVVGTERLLASGYFRAKMAQETLIKASPVPYTIVRATQFFEFVGGIAHQPPKGKRLGCPCACATHRVG